MGRDRDFREISDLGPVGAELVVRGLAVGKQDAGSQQHVSRSRKPDGDSDGCETEQIQTSVAQLLADVAGEQVHGTAEQGQGSTEKGGERQRQQHP